MQPTVQPEPTVDAAPANPLEPDASMEALNRFDLEGAAPVDEGLDPSDVDPVSLLSIGSSVLVWHRGAEHPYPGVVTRMRPRAMGQDGHMTRFTVTIITDRLPGVAFVIDPVHRSKRKGHLRETTWDFHPAE